MSQPASQQTPRNQSTMLNLFTLYKCTTEPETHNPFNLLMKFIIVSLKLMTQVLGDSPASYSYPEELPLSESLQDPESLPEPLKLLDLLPLVETLPCFAT